MKHYTIVTTIIIILLIATPIISLSATTSAESNINLDIKSESVILIDKRFGIELYSKNPDEKRYPASTTKILTAILAIENGNLKDETTVNQSALSNIPAGYSTANLVAGENILVEDLLKVLLIHSANESANVLAEYISGSVDKFVDLMNQKLKDIGCTNTHFVNANGIHNENHYTTARDLSIIARYCMKNETFRRIVSMPECTIPPTNKSGKRIYKNTNEAIIPNSNYFINNCIGIKTGFTSQAGNCIISAFSDENTELIAVVLGADEVSDRYQDLRTLREFGFNEYPQLVKERLLIESKKVSSFFYKYFILTILFSILDLI